ncbi:carbohydrate ABC transporter permease [Paenibacillus chungangensis]|uniref:Carbohydrate ABC transporter permease n=1 Tax=Paenibacillus chungangensis TaxID=696535 RepID=A0ABW3HLN6_9BACL
MLTTMSEKLASRWNMKRDMSVWRKLRYLLLGKEVDKGLLFKLFIYVILIDTAYIYLNPLFFMVTTMIKDAADLLDPAVTWVPRVIYLGTLQDAWEMLDYVKSFFMSAGLTLTIAVAQTVMCGVAGYAFARLEFPFKKFWLFCLILTFIVPPQLTILPMLLVANELNWMNQVYPLILPALFGLGLKGSLFIIIYRQFFSTQPKDLEEAARIDGANVFMLFYKVMLPLAKPAIIVVFLFSFVWNWNDFYYPGMYLISAQDVPLSLGMSKISAELAARAAEEGPSIFDEPIKMATSFLMILPPLILYMFTQRYFVEGVERTGLVE